MNIKRLHYISGLIISIFIALHLFNHAYSIPGAEAHIRLMNSLRPLYRNVFSESILLIAVAVQIVSGLKLFNASRKTASTGFEKLHVWTGFYMAVFLVIHLSAVFVGRLLLHLDTNFYFGVAGLNTFPLNLFFIPYYALAIISFFGHIAAVHRKKMRSDLLGLSPSGQALIILGCGIVLTVFIFYGLTDHFKGVEIPADYDVLTGK